MSNNVFKMFLHCDLKTIFAHRFNRERERSRTKILSKCISQWDETSSDVFLSENHCCGSKVSTDTKKACFSFVTRKTKTENPQRKHLFIWFKTRERKEGEKMQPVRMPMTWRTISNNNSNNSVNVYIGTAMTIYMMRCSGDISDGDSNSPHDSISTWMQLHLSPFEMFYLSILSDNLSDKFKTKYTGCFDAS